MTFRRDVVAAIVAFGLVACASTASGSISGSSNAQVPATVGGVGLLPPTVAVGSTAAPSGASSSSEVASTTATTVVANALGAQGDRMILIGDSILASMAPRYGNDMCSALVPLDWQAEIDAEVSRQINFANSVLAARRSAGWDAAVIALGTNFNRNYRDYLKQLERAIKTLGTIPIVLVTVSERSQVDVKVNAIIRSMPELHPNVHLLEWAKFTAAERSLLVRDGIHPSDSGRRKFTQELAALFGMAAGAGPGHCLASEFVDDSGGPTDFMPKPTIPTTEPPQSDPVGGSAPSTSRPVTSVRPTTTTVAATTSTTTVTTTIEAPPPSS